MNRFIAPLLVLPLLALVPGATAHAVGSCQGKPATLESAGGAAVVVTGTPGDDVILVGPGIAKVDALGGDDTICVAAGEIDAGPGNDSVVASGPRTSGNADVTLGPGDDHFTGTGAHRDIVDAGEDPADRAGADQIVADWVGTGAPGEPNRDVISPKRPEGVGVAIYELPAGSDLSLTGVEDLVSAVHDGASYVVDGPTSSLVRDGVRAGSFRPAGSIRYDIRSPLTSVTVNGTEVPDYVMVLEAGRVTADLGGGDDTFTLDEDVTLALGYGPTNGYEDSVVGSASFDGGPGRDYFTALSVDSVTGALGKKISFVGDHGRLDVGTAGLEHLSLMGDRIKLRGTMASESFFLSGCRVEVAGGGGQDRMTSHVDVDFSPGCSRQDYRRHARFLGGPGNDVLQGYANADVLVGGAGRDVAIGGGGTDRCVAERERSCER